MYAQQKQTNGWQKGYIMNEHQFDQFFPSSADASIPRLSWMHPDWTHFIAAWWPILSSSSATSSGGATKAHCMVCCKENGYVLPSK
jgi:hypothetical protein